jgi:hypothetical protein
VSVRCLLFVGEIKKGCKILVENLKGIGHLLSYVSPPPTRHLIASAGLEVVTETLTSFSSDLPSCRFTIARYPMP